ncbi:MAG: formimidoylglutamase [Vicingaceae bacterium]
MEFKEYFDPVPESIVKGIKQADQNQIGFNIIPSGQFFTDETLKVDLALIGVPEDRGTLENKGSAESVNDIRESFYKLFEHNQMRMVDLGNLKPGHTLQDTYLALSSVVNELMVRQIVPIIIGGSNDLAYANFLAYESLEVVVNLVSIDSAFNIGLGEEEVNSGNYLSKILLKQPNYLFNFSNIGFQSYLVGIDEINLLEKLNFDRIRLGNARAKIAHTEPIIRNADMVSIDISSVRRPDAPGNKAASPNGFYGEEICQLSRYAGMSDKLTSFGIYECNTSLDDSGQTADLAAQMLWYFIDGFYNRKGDFPKCNKEEYFKFNVTIGHPEHHIVFYKSPKSGRWWMEIPYPSDIQLKYERHLLAPCNYEDYEKAMENEIPDRWIHMYKKLL